MSQLLSASGSLERTQRRHYITEWTLQAQQRLLHQENAFFNDLLSSVLPDEVIDRLIAKQYDIFQDYASCTVMFVEVCKYDVCCGTHPHLHGSPTGAPVGNALSTCWERGGARLPL